MPVLTQQSDRVDLCLIFFCNIKWMRIKRHNTNRYDLLDPLSMIPSVGRTKNSFQSEYKGESQNKPRLDHACSCIANDKQFIMWQLALSESRWSMKFTRKLKQRDLIFDAVHSAANHHVPIIKRASR